MRGGTPVPPEGGQLARSLAPELHSSPQAVPRVTRVVRVLVLWRGPLSPKQAILDSTHNYIPGFEGEGAHRAMWSSAENIHSELMEHRLLDVLLRPAPPPSPLLPPVL